MDTNAPIIQSSPQKAVIEYPLPGTRQTHEVVPINDNLLVISQQDCSGLLKVRLEPLTGRPIAAKRYTIKSKYAGFHGLFASKQHKGCIWGTVQFESLVLLIDPQGPEVMKEPKLLRTIELPKDVWGPHVVIEDGDAIWTTCKGSGHLVKVTIVDVEQSKVEVFPCGGRPIFVAVHPTSNEVYASLDMESKILRLNQFTGARSYIEIPQERGRCPVGLVAGPDGNVWFVLVGDASGGSGTFGCISATGEVTWFKLPVFPSAGLIHLAFDHSTDDAGSSELLRIWLLASTLISKNSVDAIFALSIEGERVVRQDTICMPTQGCCTHRLLPHKTGIFVTELGVSILAHATGAAVGLQGKLSSFRQAYEVPSETSDAYGFWGLGRNSDFLIYDYEKAWGPPVGSEKQLNTPNKRVRNAEIEETE